MTNKPSGKVQVRNLPGEVVDGIAVLAAEANRSVEGHVRHVLTEAVGRAIAGKRARTRTAETAQRLGTLFDELAQVPLSPWRHAASPARVAHALGWTHAGPLRSWIDGDAEPSFEELEALAVVCGCSGDWLAFGEGPAFPPMRKRLGRDPFKAVAWLTGTASDDAPAARRLMIVRADNATGNVAFVLEYGDWSAQVVTTPYHVSLETGAGGAADLAALTLTFELLTRGPLPRELEVTGYLAEESGFELLTDGWRHPLHAMESSEIRQSVWHEDIWDSRMFERQSHWEGWTELTKRIAAHIEDSDSLKEARQTLRDPLAVRQRLGVDDA